MMEHAIQTKENRTLEGQIINFFESRIKIFKRADCDLIGELIAHQNNISSEAVMGVIENYIAKEDKIIKKNSTYFLNV